VRLGDCLEKTQRSFQQSSYEEMLYLLRSKRVEVRKDATTEAKESKKGRGGISEVRPSLSFPKGKKFRTIENNSFSKYEKERKAVKVCWGWGTHPESQRKDVSSMRQPVRGGE